MTIEVFPQPDDLVVLTQDTDFSVVSITPAIGVSEKVKCYPPSCRPSGHDMTESTSRLIGVQSSHSKAKINDVLGYENSNSALAGRNSALWRYFPSETSHQGKHK